MSNSLAAYQRARAQLLNQIVDTLSQDDRFVAAWLTGSYGRGEVDAVSDLDLNVVVMDVYAQELCAHPQMVQAGTIPPRLALISQFGHPAVLHENHFNAPAHASLTSVLYADSAMMVDWILIPQTEAQRPPMTHLLFDKAAIGMQAAAQPEPGQRLDALAERSAFFWMMLAVTAKYVVRRDDVKVQGFLDMLHHLLVDIEHLLERQYPVYHRGSLMSLQATDEAQRKTCQTLMQRMLELRPQIIKAGVDLPSAPTEVIQYLLNLR